MKLKLSMLPDDTEIATQQYLSTIYTAEDLKKEIIELGEAHHLVDGWYTVTRKEWRPDARSMLEDYIQNQYESGYLYEDWDERARDCASDILIQNMQTLLEEAFDGESVKSYWEWDKPVEIDIFPKIND